MITSYKYKKCDMFAFSNSIESVCEKCKDRSVEINYITDKNKPKKNKYNKYLSYYKSLDDIKNIVPSDEIYIAVDLTMKVFSDIDIITDIDKTKSKDKETNKQYVKPENDLQQKMAGDSTHLDAFSSNRYTVINGKKSAAIPTCFYTQNHDAIDSIARAGVVVDVKSSNKLSIKQLVENLGVHKKFVIIFIHPSLELDYIEHDSPNEISHPAYVRGEGEICAVVYRSLVLNFFGYCSVVSEKMRENKYLF